MAQLKPYNNFRIFLSDSQRTVFHFVGIFSFFLFGFSTAVMKDYSVCIGLLFVYYRGRMPRE